MKKFMTLALVLMSFSSFAGVEVLCKDSGKEFHQDAVKAANEQINTALSVRYSKIKSVSQPSISAYKSETVLGNPYVSVTICVTVEGEKLLKD
jgi:hypothetical protein